MNNLTLFIFRRDLRLQDNTALYHALKQGPVLACFIFDPRQTTERNQFRTENGLQFLIESLKELEKNLEEHAGRLYIFEGEPHHVINKLFSLISISHVFVNRDYTPFSKKRDEQINQVCQKNSVAFHSFGDALLHEPEEIYNKQNKPYTIFTPFYKNSLEQKIRTPLKISQGVFYTKNISLPQINLTYELSAKGVILTSYNHRIAELGGKSHAVKVLKHLGQFKNYTNEKDFPSIQTTRLSAHLKFGTISIRELFHGCQKTLGDSALLRQLFWRDFYTHIAFHFPHIFEGAFQKEYDALSWVYDQALFERWCYGLTGFPIVDAGMRELNATGYMHNRVRMIVASFLTKDLHMNWQLGERYFARKLVDYDPSLNNGNWQWVASTGCDPQPYFRIFNPWLQQKKFDPECEYIKKWIPELQQYSAKIIHSWDNATIASAYPKPMVDHSVQARVALKMYKNII